MTHSKLIAAGLLGAFLLATTPAPRALADGAASTRNILLGVGAAAATLIIINHNKKVHEKYAEDAQKQAALAEQRDDAQAAAAQYKKAYQEQLATSNELKKEVAVQQQQINGLKQEVAAISPPGSSFVAAKPAVAVTQRSTSSHTVTAVVPTQVVSYGWGTF
ncbi:MAG: hypothetical protein JO347_05095 [Candidatus Eremiobacteraeota bacterium]|nr:hypothetical protein [Candidatus Eremiobacteraeota bacterium]MBV8281424.1 hypothetical protein [Candidatus Eremiobacteraeota bacterium]